MKVSRFFGALCAVVFVAGSLVPVSAQAYYVGIEWTGTAGYSLAGFFSYSNSLINTGAIDETDLQSFSIEVFLDNVSLGTWDMSQGSTYVESGNLFPEDYFNFNYDTTAQAFIVGGLRASDQGQVWNFRGDFGVGFESGQQNQKISVGSTKYDESEVLTSNSTLVVTSTSAVPVPPAAYLFTTGLLGLVGVARRKRTA